MILKVKGFVGNLYTNNQGKYIAYCSCGWALQYPRSYLSIAKRDLIRHDYFAHKIEMSGTSFETELLTDNFQQYFQLYQ